MSSMFIVMSSAAGLLLVLLVYTLLRPRRGSEFKEIEALGELERSHVTYLPVIRQAMSSQDLAFLESRVQAPAVHRTHKERKQIAMLFLVQIRADFRKLLRLARIIAVMSPELAASHEFERLRLTVLFSIRYSLVLAGLHLGWLLMPQLSALSNIVSELAFRMEMSMKELGERAAVAVELASTLNRRNLDAA